MVFLDEPTSGLDSEMACQVMDSLVSLARMDRLVCCCQRNKCAQSLHTGAAQWQPCVRRLLSRLSQPQNRSRNLHAH